MPTVDIPDKICSHCGGITYRVQYHGKYTSHICILKVKEYRNSYNKLNRQKILQDHKKRHLLSERHIKAVKRRQDLQETKYKTCKTCNKIKSVSKFRKVSKYVYDYQCNSCRNKKKFIRDCTNLKDVYIKACLKWGTDLSSKDIPQELIEIKRKQLILTRKIKNNGKNQSSDNNHKDCNN